MCLLINCLSSWSSPIFEGEAVISYLEMFSFGYELSLPVNCFYHCTSSLASSGRVLQQKAAEPNSLGLGVCPGPARSRGAALGAALGTGDPCSGGPRRLLLHNLQRGPGPRPPHTPVSVTQPYGHRQAHAHKHHEDADRQTATCRHRCVSNCVSEYIQAPAHAGRCLHLWVCKLYIENSFQGLALWSSG